MSSCLEATSACIKVVVHAHCPATPIEPPAMMLHIIPAYDISMGTRRKVKAYREAKCCARLPLTFAETGDGGVGHRVESKARMGTCSSCASGVNRNRNGVRRHMRSYCKQERPEIACDACDTGSAINFWWVC